VRNSFQLSRDKAALLVIDMQRYFIDKSSDAYVPDSEKLISKIKKLVDVFMKSGRPIIYTRHIDSDDKRNLMLRWWKGQIKEADPMSQIIEELDAGKGIVLIKNQYDAFLNTNLKEILQQRDIQQVVVSGVLTNLCCETTARSAFMRGFEVYFTLDGTATYKKAMHDATSLNLAYGFAVLVSVDDVIKAIINTGKI